MTTIFYETIPIADIVTDDDLRLRYDPNWKARAGAFPISLSMPLQDEAIDAARLLPWLANLLPEAHLSEIGQQLKLSPQDVLGILKTMGRDTAGALSFDRPREAGENYRPIPDAVALERIIDELPQKPFLLGERGISMSLAGVQDKLPVYVDGETIAVPLDGTPSTHILKPDSARLAGGVQNEAFCLTLARLCGLEAARVTTGTAGRRTYLLVERYDRIATVDGKKRLHQEDFCQLLGLFPLDKYERRSGRAGKMASLKRMFGAVFDAVSPGARLDLLDGVIFNVLIGNTDSHAKNYSVLIGKDGSAKMAPLYDLMCALVYPKIDQTLPQRIGQRWNPADLHGSDWTEMARDAGLNPARTLRRVAELAARVTSSLEKAQELVAAMPAGGHGVLDQAGRAILKRCHRIERQMAKASPGVNR